MDTAAIIDLAVFASIGILLAGVATWYILPLILSTNLNIKHKKEKITTEKLGFRRFWGKPVWVIIIAVMIIFALGVGNIKQKFNMLSIYRSYTDVYKNSELISEVNGGSLPVFIYGDMPTDKNQESMVEDILRFEVGLKALDEVGKVVSAADFMEKLGDNPQALSSNMSLINEFINPVSNKLRLMVFPTDHENATLQAINLYVEDNSLEYNEYNLKATGVSYTMLELNEDMLANQINSSILAIVIVFILLLITLRHFMAALISLVPIVLSLFVLFGMMGLTGISINLFSCTIFSITIGVGIDYAIHYTSIWRTKLKEGLTSEEAAIAAYRYTSRPIVANAMGLSLGFSALMLSPLQTHVTISILMWIAMISSVVFSLIILPTFLKKIK
jgi:predicted RND superfamily exporter protein